MKTFCKTVRGLIPLFLLLFIIPSIKAQSSALEVEIAEAMSGVCDDVELTVQVGLYTDQKLIDDFYGGNTAAAQADMEASLLQAVQVFESAIPNLNFQVEGAWVIESPDIINFVQQLSIDDLESLTSKVAGYHHLTRPCVTVDMIHYFMGYSLPSPVQGKSGGGELCGEPGYENFPLIPVSVSDPINTLPIRINTLAHEIGHNLGASHLEDTNCGSECDVNSHLRPLMCDGGTTADLANLFLSSCTIQDLNTYLNQHCDCLTDEGVNNSCDRCIITTNVTASVEEYVIIEGCTDLEPITYTLTVCNDCDPNNLEIVAVNANADRLVVNDLGDFTAIQNVSATDQWLTMPLVSFAAEECKTFQFSATPVEPAGGMTVVNVGSSVVKEGGWIPNPDARYIMEIEVKVEQEPITSVFQFEDAEGNMRESFCASEQVLLNGNASDYEDRYWLRVERAPVGTSNFTGVTDGAVEGEITTINFGQWMTSQGTPLEADFIYRVTLGVQNDCDQEAESTMSFQFNFCCEAPGFMTCTVVNGETFLVWEDNSPNSTYRLFIDSSTGICCGNEDFISPTGFIVSGNQYSLNNIRSECFQWRVQAICDDEESGISAPRCMTANTPCFQAFNAPGSSSDRAGLDQAVTSSSLTVSPNPAKDKLLIVLEMPGTSGVQVEIRNLAGQLVTSFEREEAPEGIYEKEWLINPALEAGIYIIQAYTDYGMFTQQAVLLKGK